MGLADGVVEVDGREIYSAKDLKVGLFQDTSAFLMAGPLQHL